MFGVYSCEQIFFKYLDHNYTHMDKLTVSIGNMTQAVAHTKMDMFKYKGVTNRLLSILFGHCFVCFFTVSHKMFHHIC